MNMKEETIKLKIRYDADKMTHPSKWDWGYLVDVENVKVEVKN